MGEVYRARDTRLGREVAIKVLPSHLASSPEARQRFEREAKTISTLSHPHICALYDVGNQDGIEYLVMELLEGQTLADRLVKGPLPLEQTLRYGIEIADALDKAHRQGVVHRDLKPGNVMLTKSGVKLLDFGLAKVLAPAGPVENGSSLPTSGPEVTREGAILGTLSYMAPEQLEGKPCDGRADIFALGAILYEMATGRKAFSGTSQASLISSVMREDPAPISSSSRAAPEALDRLVRSCLNKDPDRRWQSASDLGLELSWMAESRSPEIGSVSPTSRTSHRQGLGWAVAVALLLTALALSILLRPSRQPSLPTELQVLPPHGTSFALQEAPEISPDGRTLAFVAVDSGGRSRLYLRPLDALAARELPDTDGASMPFWSPDSRSLGFFAAGKLRTISLSEGRPRALADAPVGRGAAWSRNGEILFVPSPPDPPSRLPAAGGTPVPIPLGPMAQVARRLFPSFLPDGRHYLYLSISGPRRERTVCLTELDGKEEKLIANSRWSAAFAPPDYVVFRRETALMAQRLDLSRREPVGEAFAVASDVGFNPITWQGLFSVSQNGVLAYHGASGALTRLTWLDRSGKETGALGAPGIYNSLSLSPDSTKVAYDQADPRTGEVNVWLAGTEGATPAPARFTFSSLVSFFPVWSPDGREVVFSTLRDGPPQLYQKVTSGAGDEEPLLRSDRAKIPTGFSSDGRFLVFAVLDPKTKFDLWVLPLFGDRHPFPFLQTEAAEIGGQISPNGRWMTYSSNESGTYEVYVRPFPPAPGKWQVSRDGGSQPRWRRDGKELFFISTDRKMMAVEVQTDLPAFSAGVPAALFETRVSNVEGSNPWSQYAVSADGRSFLVNRLSAETASSPITVILNWPALEKRSRAPAGAQEEGVMK